MWVLSCHCEPVTDVTGVAIRPPEALKISEILPGRWEDFEPPLPVADEGGTESPQPRHWRAKLTREKRVTFQACLAKQACQWHCGKAVKTKAGYAWVVT